MPFLTPDPWEKQYFPDTDIVIPVSDDEAYKQYCDHNWVYNKLELCKKQGIEAYPHGIVPKKFPVFSKPITNMFGMSINARPIDESIIDDDNEWSVADYCPGHFWMPILEGPQRSTDYVLLNGRTMWHSSMAPIVDGKGSFVGWEKTHFPEEMQEFIDHWTWMWLSEFTGVVNFETIGDCIIECHLRMSPQFVDLYGTRWINDVEYLYRYKHWSRTLKTYYGKSHVVRVDEDFIPYITDEEKLKELRQEVSSIQLTWYDNEPLSICADDGQSYRLAVINGDAPSTLEKVAEELLKIIGRR